MISRLLKKPKLEWFKNHWFYLTFVRLYCSADLNQIYLVIIQFVDRYELLHEVYFGGRGGVPSAIKNFVVASEGNLKRENKIWDFSCI